MPVVSKNPPTSSIGANRAIERTPAKAESPVNLSMVPDSVFWLSRLDIDSRLPAKFERMLNVTRWEYATVPLLLHKEAQILNAWGVDGWELVSVEAGPAGGLIAFMKRPVA
jgi:hypothetical protein